MNDGFLKKQIITYMGNKRKFMDILSDIVDNISNELDKPLVLGDGFSGSGVVSRLFKIKSKSLYTNDIAGYSETLNNCFLSTPTKKELKNIHDYIDAANKLAHGTEDFPYEKWVQLHWAPHHSNPQKQDRVYYTKQNAILIDKYKSIIETIPKKYRHYLLAELLVEASIHNNTNGQFSAFYKGEDGIGKFGGKKEIDLRRILAPIILQNPILSSSPCNVNISRMDTNEWVKKIPEVDLMYFDPPYNKHPYSIYFFMLDMINDWDTDIEIPGTNRGQPKNWFNSGYNSFTHAKKVFEDLIKNTKAKFILLSYNNGGIIPIPELEKILKKYGSLTKIPFQHKTYRKFQGIAAYKRKKEFSDVKEFLWLLDCRK